MSFWNRRPSRTGPRVYVVGSREDFARWVQEHQDNFRYENVHDACQVRGMVHTCPAAKFVVLPSADFRALLHLHTAGFGVDRPQPQVSEREKQIRHWKEKLARFGDPMSGDFDAEPQPNEAQSKVSVLPATQGAQSGLTPPVIANADGLGKTGEPGPVQLINPHVAHQQPGQGAGVLSHGRPTNNEASRLGGCVAWCIGGAVVILLLKATSGMILLVFPLLFLVAGGMGTAEWVFGERPSKIQIGFGVVLVILAVVILGSLMPSGCHSSADFEPDGNFRPR